MIVYIDLIFLLNFLIDGATLQTTAWARKMKASPWKIAIAAAIGATYVLMLFAPPLSFLYTFTMKFLLSVLMVYIAFGFVSLRAFLHNLAMFYMVNFAAAGLIFASSYIIQSSQEVMNGILFSQASGPAFQSHLSGLLLIVLFPLGIIFYRIVMAQQGKKQLATQFFAKAQVYVDDHYSECTGLIDTGNQLYDPFSKTPVMIMEVFHWRNALPEQWIRLIEQNEPDDLLNAIGEQTFKWQHRLRFIPFKGIHDHAQFMLAIKPDKVVISYAEQVVETSNVWIGLSGSKLSADGSYAAIIHPALMNSTGR